MSIKHFKTDHTSSQFQHQWIENSCNILSVRVTFLSSADTETQHISSTRRTDDESRRERTVATVQCSPQHWTALLVMQRTHQEKAELHTQRALNSWNHRIHNDNQESVLWTWCAKHKMEKKNAIGTYTASILIDYQITSEKNCGTIDSDGLND